MPVTTLADVASSAAAAVGVPGFADVIDVRPCRQVIVCLVDGLGWNALQAHAHLAPTLAGMSGGSVSAPFPTTTPVGLGSLGTGLLPGMHGLVGASFLLPETDAVLTPLHWGADPSPLAVQPEPTVFEAVARAGVAMSTVSPAAYEASGLTRAVLRGARYLAAEDVAERIARVQQTLAAGERSFTYVYWPEIDRVGHEFGVSSREWRAALVRAEVLVRRLAESLVPGSTLIVTADHGMVDCPVEERIQLESSRILMNGIERIAGEPRARHVYVTPGAASDVRAAWQHEIGDRVRILLRSELIEAGLLGAVEPSIAERIGDVMAISKGAAMLASRVDATVSRLIGQHGALSADEVLIPALLHRRD